LNRQLCPFIGPTPAIPLSVSDARIPRRISQMAAQP
jgi:hypothetical protein